MSIETAEQLAALRRAGALARRTLRELAGAVHPGVTTGALDDLAARAFGAAGARSAPAELVGFPGTICISVNDEVRARRAGLAAAARRRPRDARRHPAAGRIAPTRRRPSASAGPIPPPAGCCVPSTPACERPSRRR